MDKKKFARMLCLVVGLYGYPASAERVALSELCDTVLIDLLSTAEWIVERDRGDLFVRIYRLRENPPACADQPGPCPRERLFIALARQGSEKKVFLLPHAVAWENPQWIEEAEKQPLVPSQSHPWIQMTIEEKFVDPSSEGKKVAIRKRRLSFNIQEARISP